MIIHPEILVTPDRPVVLFREPRDQVDLDKELPRILSAQGWGVGTYFHVQFVSHDRTTLLSSAEFVVTSVNEGLHTSEANPYQPVTRAIFMRKAEQIGRWWIPEALTEGEDIPEAKQVEAPPPATKPKKVAKAG